MPALETKGPLFDRSIRRNSVMHVRTIRNSFTIALLLAQTIPPSFVSPVTVHIDVVFLPLFDY